MKTSQNGLALIEAAEGFKAKAYTDPSTGGAPWTAGTVK
jgi:lysozyme